MIPEGFTGRNDYCGAPIGELDECTKQWFDDIKLKDFWKTDCLDKNECRIDFTDYLRKKPLNAKTKCDIKNAVVYGQYTCDEHESMQWRKQAQYIIGFIGLVSCFLFSAITYYQLNVSQLEEKKWDISTVTTADFTVEINISQEFWNYWLEFKKGERALLRDKKKTNQTTFHKYFFEQLE